MLTVACPRSNSIDVDGSVVDLAGAVEERGVRLVQDVAHDGVEQADGAAEEGHAVLPALRAFERPRPEVFQVSEHVLRSRRSATGVVHGSHATGATAVQDAAASGSNASSDTGAAFGWAAWIDGTRSGRGDPQRGRLVGEHPSMESASLTTMTSTPLHAGAIMRSGGGLYRP